MLVQTNLFEKQQEERDNLMYFVEPQATIEIVK